MSDYSLRNVASRPARMGDKLVSTSFPTSSTRGFAAAGEPNESRRADRGCSRSLKISSGQGIGSRGRGEGRVLPGNRRISLQREQCLLQWGPRLLRFSHYTNRRRAHVRAFEPRPSFFVAISPPPLICRSA
jgi:hypothetical protein